MANDETLQALRLWFLGHGERPELPETWDDTWTLRAVEEAARQERAEHTRRGIPPEITEATLQDVGIWSRHCQRTRGTHGISDQHLGWFKLHASGRLCRLGRLQFAIETYDWTEGEVPGLMQGDTVLGMHIPAEAPLDIEECKKSLAAAFPFFDTYFPERLPAKAIVCSSWMLGDWVPEAAGIGGSLDRFQQLFQLLPGGTSPGSACYFVFGYREVDPATAPRDTRLRRNLLALIEAGNPVNSGRCYLLREEAL
jgi:GNAT-like C-terminal domain/N-acyltransferase N-terminal domain